MCFEYLRAGSPLLDTSFIRTHKLDNLESITHLLVAQPRMDDLLTANSRGAVYLSSISESDSFDQFALTTARTYSVGGRFSCDG